jgi:hypothetical protein
VDHFPDLSRDVFVSLFHEDLGGALTVVEKLANFLDFVF